MEHRADRAGAKPQPEGFRAPVTISQTSDFFLIRKVAVLGAGSMGSRIAALFANAGIPVILLDRVPEESTLLDQVLRNRLASGALDALKTSKPAVFYEPQVVRLITVGNFEDHLDLLQECDWIIEAVSENLEIKQNLLAKIAPYRRPGTFITTNTSGLPIAKIASQMSEEFRRHWLGTHFFNPPRYMRLLEIVAGPDTSAPVIEAVCKFADKRLGKTVVFAKDTPNFIANRIGIFALLNTIRIMQNMDLTIEQVDVLTGSVLGWPKTGTFRLSDLVGIDVLAHVAENFVAFVKDERADLGLPEWIHQMLAHKWLGDKVKQGFYRKTKGLTGREERLGLDWKTLEYRPSLKPEFPFLDLAKNAGSVADRLQAILHRSLPGDAAAAFYWQILPELWNYSANRLGEIADDIVSIDRAMKAGFNWELGPFELWDAAGVPLTVARMVAAGIPLAPAVTALLAGGNTSWYRPCADGMSYFDPVTAAYKSAETPDGISSITAIARSCGVVKRNAGASLIDLGHGVAALEFHSKMNAIGGDILSLVTHTLKPGSGALRDFDAFVIANDGANFSAGADLLQLLLAIQEQEWEEIDTVVRSFQNMTQLIKFCPRPVVAAPFNLCLGGGAEVIMHAAGRQAHAELYVGLVETGVGLIPAGGGCKEVLLRSIDASTPFPTNGAPESIEFSNTLRRHFETIALAKVSTSAFEARSSGFLTLNDGITFNRDRLLSDAKARALALVDAGYSAPLPRTTIPAPGESVLATLRMSVRLMHEGAFISDHDMKIAHAVAHVLCGGKLTPGTPLSEQYLLDLEREAFLSLCGEKKTAERIAHTLKTGKPLRN